MRKSLFDKWFRSEPEREIHGRGRLRVHKEGRIAIAPEACLQARRGAERGGRSPWISQPGAVGSIYQTSSNLALTCFVIFLVSCSVRPKDIGTTPIAGNQLIDGVYLSQNRKFLMRPSTVDLVPNEENTVHYTILSPELRPLDGSHSFEAESDMPTMPQMGGPWKAEKLAVESDGRLAATYLIWHGHPTHLWQFTIHILRDGKEIDRFTYSHLVRIE